VPDAITETKSWPPRWLTAVDDSELAASRGWEVADFINSMCIQTKDTVAGRSGQQIVLRDWQEKLLDNIFAVRDDGRFKNRTALLVCLVRTENRLCHLVLLFGVYLWVSNVAKFILVLLIEIRHELFSVMLRK
jgi:hypothetical protein